MYATTNCHAEIVKAMLVERADAISEQTQSETLTIRKVFHIAGIPRTPRNSRGDLILTNDDLIFRRGKRELLRIPFQDLRRVQLLGGARDKAGRAVVIAAATYGIGGLMMALQSKVDTLVFDFSNANGGLMGLALQVPKNEGKRCQEWLARFGVKVEETLPSTAPPKD